MPPRAAVPKIAIVGRPNVGKSSLMNRLAGRRISIVDPAPGVTRDRVSAMVQIHPPTETPRGTPARSAELIDTGGYGVYTAQGKRFDDVGADLSTLTGEIERQIRTALRQADIILFVLDAHSGITPLDQAIADLIRKSGRGDRTLAVANKVDGEKWLAHGLEAAALGFGEPLCVSAENSFGVRLLTEALWQRLPESAADDPAAIEPALDEVKIAIVGKRNSGKSTLINAWAGEPRVIVSEIAGTTRDSVDVRIEINGGAILAIDTAGLRKRKSFADDIEYYASTRMLAAIRRADVVVLMVDAAEEVSQVDQQLAQEIQQEFKPVVIAVNKWDLASRRRPPLKPDAYLEYLTQQLRGLEYAPIVFISAKGSAGLKDLAAMAFNLHQQASHREPTHRLNEAVGQIMKQRGPSSRHGARAKVYYVSQVATQPPTIVMVVNDPKLFEGQYERYLLNQLREVLPYSEVPIRIFFRRRERVPLHEMKKRGRRAQRMRDAGDA